MPVCHGRQPMYNTSRAVDKKQPAVAPPAHPELQITKASKQAMLFSQVVPVEPRVVHSVSSDAQ